MLENRRMLGLLIWILCGMSFAMGPEKLSQLTLAASTTDLLNGRLAVRVPSNGKSTGIQHGIMAAPESNTEVSRIEINNGQQRVILMVYELFARAGNDFENAARKEAGKLPMKVEVQPWPLPAPLTAYAYFPLQPTQKEEANLVMGVYLKQADGTVQVLAFFANPAAAMRSSDAVGLAKSISRTIIPGKKLLNTKAGDRQLGEHSDSIVVSIPEGYVTTLQNGPDFLVHHIRKITVFGEAPASIGLYLGNFPSKPSGSLTRKGKVTLFGKETQWLEESSNEHGREILVDNAVIEIGKTFPAFAHVFVSGDALAIEELRKVASTLRFNQRER